MTVPDDALYVIQESAEYLCNELKEVTISSDMSDPNDLIYCKYELDSKDYAPDSYPYIEKGFIRIVKWVEDGNTFYTYERLQMMFFD